MAKFRSKHKRLTLRQREVFDFIEKFIAEVGYSPTIQEIGKAFGFSEKAAFDHVNALVRKGMIERREDYVPRSIKLTLHFRTTVFMESPGGYTASRYSKRRFPDGEPCCGSCCRRSCADDARDYHRISRGAADSRQGCRAIASIGCRREPSSNERSNTFKSGRRELRFPTPC